jgi:hypothetical protein
MISRAGRWLLWIVDKNSMRRASPSARRDSRHPGPSQEPINEFGTERRFAPDAGRLRLEGRAEEAGSPVHATKGLNLRSVRRGVGVRIRGIFRKAESAALAACDGFCVKGFAASSAADRPGLGRGELIFGQ